MYQLLDTLGVFGLLVVFIVTIVGMIFLFRAVMNKKTSQILDENRQSDVRTKKYYSVDITKYSTLLGVIGLNLSLAFTLAAFEFPDFGEKELVDLGTLDADVEELIEIPPTEQKPPPPPKVQQPEIVEVPDEEEIEEEIEIDLDVEIDEETVVEEIIVSDEPEEEETVSNEIFTIVEESAAPKGGMQAFYQYVAKNMKYPSQARRMGIEGKVFVQFVVDKDGTITDVKAIRGIGGGADEEAVRVVKNADKWTPGKQRGRPVRQRIVIPINFKLQ
ncbi:energy transducer TonB [Rapidithrix thailandica]|uniref:Energy transducer TonB n=1 Tax=Rapidithrix thailandica TaxID=413964 RepID=A0AAW9RW59_9BACT